MSRWLVGFGLLAVSVVLASLSLAETLWGDPHGEIVVGPGKPATIEWVLPGGPAWQDGLRLGQTVLSLTSGIDHGSWRLVATDGVGTYVATFSSFERQLRDSWPLGVAALAFALASLVCFHNRPLASALIVVSIAASAQSLLPTGLVFQSSVAGLLAVVVPAVWLCGWSGWRRSARVATLSVAIVIGIAWLISRSAVPSAFDGMELAREFMFGASVAAIVAFLAERHDWRVGRDLLRHRDWTDLVALGTVLATLVLIAVATELPMMLIASVVGIAVLAYPRLRRRVGDAVDDVVLSDLRSRARLQAVEDERGRIARDLHDSPLQEIAAVIRDLERRGDSGGQANTLRSVAGHLRRVTTELRPPVLDDLGLGAAISYVIDQAAHADETIDVIGEVEPDDPLAPRPPADVELAVFRIVQEAVENAVQHAGATTIDVSARVDPCEVRVVVDDDGQGIRKEDRRNALRSGHAGLVTMAERAAQIGASLEIRQLEPSGTSVSVLWRSAT